LSDLFTFVVLLKIIVMIHPMIDLQKNLPQNIVVLLSYYNRQAVGHLSRKGFVNKHVHQARLCCKRIRSILRLVRPALKKMDYVKYNTLYRDASRKLSYARDLTALAETIDLLASATSSQNLTVFLKKEKNSLVRRRTILVQSAEFQYAKKEVIATFTESESELSNIDFLHNEIVVLLKGLIKTYDKGAKFLEINTNQTDSHLMHEWRKQVKYTWYQLVVLSPLWPVIFEAFIKEFQALSKMLGQYQDLTLLHEYLNEQRNHTKSPKEIAAGLRLITIRKKDLAKRSLQLGKKLYALPKGKELIGWLQNLLNPELQMG